MAGDEPTTEAVVVELPVPAPKERRGRRERIRLPKQPRRDRHMSPAMRRAELIAAAEAITAAAAAKDGRTSRRGPATTTRRLLALGAIATLVVAIAIVVAGRAPDHPLARGDASFIAGQLAGADQRVRVQLPLLAARGTARALDRTRDAIVTTRSLSIEMRHATGDDAARLRRALRLRGRVAGCRRLDAVQSQQPAARAARRT